MGGIAGPEPGEREKRRAEAGKLWFFHIGTRESPCKGGNCGGEEHELFKEEREKTTGK